MNFFEENATEASEVALQTLLHYTHILRIIIIANQMDVQRQRKITLSKAFSLPADMKMEEAIWAVLH